jgi:hypothetical protein
MHQLRRLPCGCCVRATGSRHASPWDGLVDGVPQYVWKEVALGILQVIGPSDPGGNVALRSRRCRHTGAAGRSDARIVDGGLRPAQNVGQINGQHHLGGDVVLQTERLKQGCEACQ